MPVPQGQITTTQSWTKPAEPTLEEAIVAADAEVAVEEYVVEKPAPKKRAKKV
jgi:predicted house-cleaning NTP pyrophosphatase (Maf/HAM1 superfamily)